MRTAVIIGALIGVVVAAWSPLLWLAYQTHQLQMETQSWIAETKASRPEINHPETSP